MPRSRRATWLAALLVTVPAVSAQAPPAPPRSPVVVDTLLTDSLQSVRLSASGLDRGEAEVWRFHVLRVRAPAGRAGRSDVWVETEDPFGGRSLSPLFYQSTISERARAVQAAEAPRVNFNLPYTVFLGVLAVLGLSVALVVAFPAYVYRRRYRRERERRAALQATARRLAAGREEERKRLARDLHDGPLQDLHALHMQLGLAVEALDDALGHGAVEARRLRGAQDEARTVIGELRGIAEALRPPALGPFGLAAALRAHAERFRRRHPAIAVALALDDDGQALAEPVRTALFRIAQEAMANAAKHAAPTAVAVGLRLSGRTATLTVEDDGAGYGGDPDDPALAAAGHFGLLGMRERADAVGASVEVVDYGGGVRVRAVAPLEAAPDG